MFNAAALLHRVARIRRAVRLCAVLLAGVLGASAAHADIWGFIDERGIVHFAAEKLDERYELYYKGGDAPDAWHPVVVAPQGGVALTPEQAARGNKLRTYFDISPSYKAVQHHLKEASRTHQIDLDLLKALIITESGFDPKAVSPKGAVGLMQLMPATAQRYGVRADSQRSIEQKLADPKTNVQAGTRYLSDLMRLFPGQTELALAAYNAGEGAVQRAGNKIPNYKETQNYVKTIMQLYAMLKPGSPLLIPGAGRANVSDANRRVRVQLGAAAAPPQARQLTLADAQTPAAAYPALPAATTPSNPLSLQSSLQ